MTYIELINKYLWEYVLLFMLLGTGVFYTFRLRAVQIRYFPRIFTSVFGKDAHTDKADMNGISSFQAVTTSIAAQVGTGNIAGTATAIVSGGPGAIFWMWCSAFFGMATIFAETVLAQIYKTKIGDETVSGPAYYIDKGLGSRKLAMIFAICIIFALGFIGNMVQSNSISHAFYNSFGINHAYLGVFIALFVGLIIFGGIKRIAAFTEMVVPIMALFYLIGCGTILYLRSDYIFPAFQNIFTSAFKLESATGGLAGITIKEALRYGVARGLFSNEAGMGSTPHAHGIAKVKNPCVQGKVAIFSVFFDSFIILTLSALVILVSPFYLEMIEGPASESVTSIILAQGAFSSILGEYGSYFIAIIILFFAFSTMISWYYFAATNVKYLFGTKIINLFRLMIIICVFMGAFAKVDMIWELADTFNGLMCIPNLIALIALSGLVAKTVRGYEAGN